MNGGDVVVFGLLAGICVFTAFHATKKYRKRPKPAFEKSFRRVRGIVGAPVEIVYAAPAQCAALCQDRMLGAFAVDPKTWSCALFFKDGFRVTTARRRGTSRNRRRLYYVRR